MKILRPDVKAMPEVIATLKKGGVIAHAADTCFGLAADLMSEGALKKIQKIKGRDAKKPMSIMLPAYLKSKLSDYAKMDEFAQMVSDALLPGPVTIVLPKGPKIPAYYFPETDCIGIRMLYDMFTEDLLTKFHGPLITTSANLSSQPPCCRHEEVAKAFKGKKNQPDILLTGEIKHDCKPSTVLEVKDGKIRILREGPLNKEEIEAILGVRID